MKLSDSFEKLLKANSERILVLDGAMGTMIQRHPLTEQDFRCDVWKDHHKPLKGNNDLLSVTRPDIIKDIHEAYFRAGADIVETNTFSSTTIAQEDYDMEEHIQLLNVESARIAKEVANKMTELEPHKPRFVAGSIGPTNRTASLSPDVNNPGFRAVTFDDLRIAYADQARYLIEGGADILLVETVFDTLNAKAALFGIQEVFDELGEVYPIMVSGTITDASGRTLSGQTAHAFQVSMSHAPLYSLGFNCALGASQLSPYLQVLAHESDSRISAHPNAGLPNELGEYDQTPDDMAEQIRDYLERGLINIIGGCCGTSPDHISAIAKVAQEYKPRLLPTLENVSTE